MSIYFRSLVARLKVVSPSEFWQMTPNEASIILDEYIKENENNPINESGITQRQLDLIEQRRQELIEKGINVL